MTEAMLSKKIGSELAPKENRIVFCDGLYQESLSNAAVFPKGVSLSTDGGFYLNIPDKVIIEDMIHIVFLDGEKPVAQRANEYFPVEVLAGASTRLNLVLHKMSSSAGNFFCQNISTKFFMSEGACVDFYQIEEPGLGGDYSMENIFDLSKHSSFDYFVFAGAAGASRTKSTVDFHGEHGFFSAKGISLLTGRANAQHTLWANHRVPHCISRQYYKNILAGDSRAGFVSFVHVFENASKSDSQQLNRNLLLSERAQAESRPELRIDNDDVIASHGSASGQIEDNELFYLQSRGLSKQDARLVLVDGFAQELLGDVHEQHLKTYLEAVIRKGIAGIGGDSQK